jgi:PAS domain S-box-containing protein
MTNDLRSRVLLLTPTGRDASLICGTLLESGIKGAVSADAPMLAAEIAVGAGAVIIAEEALSSSAIALVTAALKAQPPWSDLPVIVLSSTGESTAITNHWLAQLGPLGNVTVIERPVRPATLISVIRATLRARSRQYDVERLLCDVNVAQDRLRTMVESAHDYAILNLDLNGRVTYWNAGAERLLRYKEEAVLGRSFDFMFSEEERGAGVPSRKLETAVQIGRAESEGWCIRSDGSRFWASGVICPTRDAGGNVTGYVKVMRDMTEQKEFAERLTEQARALQRSNEDLQRFAYVASHDLQEPLRMIGSYSQLLVRRNADRLDEDSKQFVRFIVAGVERMRTLIRDLLEFSRITSEEEHEPGLVDCHVVLGLALQQLQFKISETRANITFDRLPVVLAHETRLLQVFQNLIGNALKYCDTTPRVHVSATRQGDLWRIAIGDNGIGIAPEYQEKVFALFQRLHSRTEYPGTGIGLAACKRIIEQHGGRIWLESAKGKGSTFYFTLPAAYPEEPTQNERYPSATLSGAPGILR